VVIIPVHINSEHEPALSAEARVPEPISSRRYRLEMTASISLERDLECRPSEVEGVVADSTLLVAREDVSETRSGMDADLRQGLDHEVLAGVPIEPTGR
jgi:hypothetical protein